MKGDVQYDTGNRRSGCRFLHNSPDCLADYWFTGGLPGDKSGTRPHFGIIGDIVIGLVGAFLAGLVLRILLPDTTLGFVGEIIAAFIGAVILLAILRFIARQTGRPST